MRGNVRLCVPTCPALFIDSEEGITKDDIQFEADEVARYEKFMRSGRKPWRRHWPKRRYESVALLGLMASDEGLVNQDAIV